MVESHQSIVLQHVHLSKRCTCSYYVHAFHPSIENFDAAVEKLLELWQSVLQRGILLQDAARFLKMMVINIFSIHHAAERHSGNAVLDNHLVLIIHVY